MKFTPQYIEKNPRTGREYAFIFSGTDILLNINTIPRLTEVSELLAANNIEPMKDGLYIGSIDGTGCIAFDLPEDFDSGTYSLSAEDREHPHRFVLLRHCVGQLDMFINAAAGYASHILHWHRHSLFCGRCGSENSWHKNECAKVCSSCGNIQFPRISPAVIIVIRKGDEILLAHNRRFPEGRYSLLAGFMEMGETIEQTAVREVREEVGIEIENIEYIASQSWPFPDSLMLGLVADYKSGDLQPDGTEIMDAGWYTPDKFPSIPEHGTIARTLIDKYTKTST